MSDPLHPVNRAWVLFDPLIKPPPRGQNLILINAGGTLCTGPWHEGALAWGYKPIVPESVKAREREKLQRLLQNQKERESTYDPESEDWSAYPD